MNKRRRRTYLEVLAADKRVDEISVEGSDGIWVYLKRGWVGGPEEHLVHEWTIKDLRDAMSGVYRCHCCEECRAVHAPRQSSKVA